MATETIRTVKITWTDADGNSAALGLDETITTDWTDAECLEAAAYNAECAGVDLDRFHPEIEEVTG